MRPVGLVTRTVGFALGAVAMTGSLVASGATTPDDGPDAVTAREEGTLPVSPPDALDTSDSADQVGSVAPVDAARASATRLATGGTTQVATALDALPDHARLSYSLTAGAFADADPTCGLTWTLLAAIGQVESDHGRADGATLGDDGVSTPQLLGPRLDGKGGRLEVADTDSGTLDGDTRWDRGVGPMQLLPATWPQVAVDGDGDGVRSPHDLDDAALAAGVYLCSVGDGLDTADGRRAALEAYNDSPGYAATVVALAESYDALAAAPEPPTYVATEPPTSGPWSSAARDGFGQGGSGQGGTGSTSDAGDAPGRSGKSGHDEPKDGKQDGKKDGDKGNRDGEDDKGGEDDKDDKGTDEPGRDDKPGKPGGEPDRPGEPGSDNDHPGETPKPTPTPSPSPTPSPEPEPTCPEAPVPAVPVEEPVVADLSGTLTACDGVWILDDPVRDSVTEEDLVLDVGDETWLASPALADLDLDGVVETNIEELTGLVDQEVVVSVEESTGVPVVYAVNEVGYRTVG